MYDLNLTQSLPHTYKGVDCIKMTQLSLAPLEYTHLYLYILLHMGIKYIYPIFLFHPPKENRKQKKSKSGPILEGAFRIVSTDTDWAGAEPQTGKEQMSPKHKLVNTWMMRPAHSL